MEKIKSAILQLLSKIDRPGMDELIAFLEESDFFTAPASTKYHCNYETGLAEHSLNVEIGFERKAKGFKANIPQDSIILGGLLHDVCKINFYVKEQKWRKDDQGKWESYETYGINDQLPLGHGEKSLSIIQDFIQLTPFEKMLIRWHMGKPEDPMETYSYNAAVDMFPEIVLLQTADLEASRMLEKTAEQLKGEK